MAPKQPKPQLDHVVLLLPHTTLTNPPNWLTTNFTLSAGGRHADNKTENRLILFRDGTYLELISFINDDPARRAGHWWDKPYGVVDFAFTTPEDGPGLDHEALEARLRDSGSGVGYDPPMEGGRTKPDGSELRWRVTFPDERVQRGEVPFWCEDVTPRERRVPLTREATEHACGVSGMAGLRVMIGKKEKEGEGEGKLERCSTAMAAILDVEKQANNAYEVGLPVGIVARKTPMLRWEEMKGDGDDGLDLRLALVLQTEDGKAREGIREKIGEDGLVLIEFE